MGYKVFINEACDRYEDVPVRTHRKKRLRKKYAKKYGHKKVLVASDIFMTKDRHIVMGPTSLRKILAEVETQTPPEKFNLCGL